MQSPPVGQSRLASLEAGIADAKQRLAAAKLFRDALYKQYLESRSSIDTLVSRRAAAVRPKVLS